MSTDELKARIQETVNQTLRTLSSDPEQALALLRDFAGDYDPASPTQLATTSDALLQELHALIDETRAKVAAAVNASLTMLYWRIGKRINEDVLQGERAAYGERLIDDLAQQLTEDHGRGFSPANLRPMVQFATVFPDEQIVASLIRKLS
jgi:hypothetical protein